MGDGAAALKANNLMQLANAVSWPHTPLQSSPLQSDLLD